MAPGGDQLGADCVRHLEAARTGIVLDRMVGPGLGESLLLTGERQRVRALHAAYDAVDGHEQIVMIFSCSDRKPSHHLGIKIPRVGLPLLRRYPRMNAEASGSRIGKMGRRCRCRSTDLV